MAARELLKGDAFLYKGKTYLATKVEIVNGHVKVETNGGMLSLKPDEVLELV